MFKGMTTTTDKPTVDKVEGLTEAELNVGKQHFFELTRPLQKYIMEKTLWDMYVQYHNWIGALPGPLGKKVSREGRRMTRIVDSLTNALSSGVMSPRKVLTKVTILQEVTRRLDEAEGYYQGDFLAAFPHVELTNDELKMVEATLRLVNR
jgi:hypothetical protein